MKKRTLLLVTVGAMGLAVLIPLMVIRPGDDDPDPAAYAGLESTGPDVGEGQVEEPRNIGSMPSDLPAVAQEDNSAGREARLVLRGNRLMAEGKSREALRAFSSVLASALDRKSVEAAAPKFYVLCRELGVFEERLQTFESIHSARPADRKVMAVLAELYACAGERANECVMRQKLAEHQPGELSNLQKLLSAQQSLGNYPDAAATAKRLSRIDRGRAGQYLVKAALIELEDNRPDAARATCEQALATGILGPGSLLRVGRIYASMGDQPAALATLEKAHAESTRQFRKERCLVEICRIKLQLGAIDDESLSTLEHLAEHAIADGVRRDARQLIDRETG